MKRILSAQLLTLGLLLASDFAGGSGKLKTQASDFH